MKITFHKDLDDMSKLNRILVSIDGNPATFEQLDLVLFALNNDYMSAVIYAAFPQPLPIPPKE